jgi:hypothetical protein
VDLPDNVSVTAASLIVNAAGTAKVKTIVLITPEEVDQTTDWLRKWRPSKTVPLYRL